MSSSNDAMRNANVRLCRLRAWSSYEGFGFNLEPSQSPPFSVRLVESNSPAAAGGLKISDIILAVNNKEVTVSTTFNDVGRSIKAARETNQPIELLVVERRFYETLKSKVESFDPTLAILKETPASMPRNYSNFPLHTPRTCEIRLNQSDTSFGFEITNGEKDIGLYIQEVAVNSPASQTPLRKSDRILEVDDKFVNKEASKSIIEKLGKAKTKRAVKLYVVDTATYKHFQDNKIPLQSKDFRKSKFAKQLLTRRQNEPNDTAPEDIRLCTINRTSITDSYGIEVNYHKRDQYHSLKITSGHNNEQTNAERAGVKAEDRLIEINGQNVENLSSDVVKQCIRAIMYPEPLQLLVADTATYEYYKKNNKVIHRGLPSVRNMDDVIRRRGPSSDASPYRPTDTRTSSESSEETQGRPKTEPPSGIQRLVFNNPLSGKSYSIDRQPSITHPTTGRRQCRLRRIANFQGYGFNVSSNQSDAGGHKVSQITPSSPAELQGLHIGDYILSVNGKNVERMTAVEFNQFLRSEVQGDSAGGGSILLEVKDGDSYEPEPPVIDVIHKSRTTSHVSTRPSSITNEPYPEIRLCTIRSWPDFDDFGFEINQAISSSTDPDGFQIQRLQINSPAERANIRNGDRLIEVNDVNIETKNFQYVDQLINNAFHQNGRIELLVIDNDGYQWYKKRRMLIDPLDDNANVTRYQTPEPPISNLVGSLDVRAAAPTLTAARSQQTSEQNFPNNYDEPKTYDRKPSIPTRPFRPLSRAAVNVVSGKSMFRFCRLNTEPGQSFGFELAFERSKHVIRHINEGSAAGLAGLNDRDCVIEIDDENVTGKSHKDVADLLKNASHNGVVRLLITPGDIIPLTQRSVKSLSALNHERYYRDTTSWSTNDGQQQPSSIRRHQSTLRLNREQPYSTNEFTYKSSEPSEPFPRQCVLVQDESFRGCGFRLSEKENYDTPIVVEVCANSPAKRSGLTEGDHIMYIDSQNVQNLRSFNDMTDLIQRIFKKNGQITLIALTGPAYQVLKRRGGYLESAIFDYQLPIVNEMKPRLCQLTLYKHEHGFGFTSQPNNSLCIQNVESGSSADVHGIQKDDRILELNGFDTTVLSVTQIHDILETSVKERKLDILVIDKNGYEFSLKHAIPLNSLLPFVQTRQERAMTISRNQNEPVYL